MKKLRLSIHSKEHIYLRKILTERRLELGLSQRSLGQKMGVLYSFIGKIETGDRRLDVFEFITYCKGLDLEPTKVLKLLEDFNENNLDKSD